MIKSLRKCLSVKDVNEYLSFYVSVFVILAAVFHVYSQESKSIVKPEFMSPCGVIRLNSFIESYENDTKLEWFKRTPLADAMIKHWIKEGANVLIFPLNTNASDFISKEPVSIEDFPFAKVKLEEAERLLSPQFEREISEAEISDFCFSRFAHDNREKKGKVVGLFYKSNIFDEIISDVKTDHQKAPLKYAYASSLQVYTAVVIRNISNETVEDIRITVDSSLYPGLKIYDRYRNVTDGVVSTMAAGTLRVFYLESTGTGVAEEHVSISLAEKLVLERKKTKKALVWAAIIGVPLLICRLFFV